jgi:heme exporter protein D
MEAIKAKINFNNSGYYFIGLYVLAVLGFWPSYFAKFFNGAGDFAFYFHFHAAMVTLWVFCLVIQPMLIRKKMLSLHRLIGKASYVIMPMLFLSVILLAHYRIPSHIVVINNEKNYGLHLFIPFKDLLVLGMMYTLAIRCRHNIHIHARAMVATGIVFIEPALVRLIRIISNGSVISYPLTIFIIYSILISLIIRERHQKKGRWVFPLVLGLYIIIHFIILFKIQIWPWEMFSRWFARLNIT